MTSLRREGRSLFLGFLLGAWVLTLVAVPLVFALEPATAGASAGPAFASADRDGDGFVSRREAAAIPGLGSVIPNADLNFDGRLDQVEYARALGLRRN
jgi:hypothetical protein